MMHTIGAAALALALGTIVSADPELRAGVARVEITPSKFMTMYGYANRNCGPANGTHDPLFAKALVLQAGDSRMVVVTFDEGMMISESLIRNIRTKLNIPVVLLAASHTHSGPSFLKNDGTPADYPVAKEYLTSVEAAVFHAVEEASKSLFPARLGVGRSSLQLGYNRLVLRDDGRARAVFDNLERVPYGPVDPEIILLRVEDPDGNARALLVHYATHAVVLGPTSCKYSADYPGVMQGKVEQELKGTQVMFVQGGAGDINPLFEGRSGHEDEDFSVMQKMGELLAAEVVRANRNVQPLKPVTASIQSKAEVLTFKDRWEKDKTMNVGITTVLINGQVAIAATAGEPMHRLQTMWKEQAGVPCPLFYGYTFSAGGVWPGYLPDIRTAAYGGYGADVATRIEVGAAETIMQHHLINLYDLRGMWHERPGRP